MQKRKMPPFLFAGILVLLIMLAFASCAGASAVATPTPLPTVTDRPLGKLQTPVISMPSQFAAGEEIYMYIEEVPNAYGYEIEVIKNGRSEGVMHASSAGRCVVFPFGLSAGSYSALVRATGFLESSNAALFNFSVNGNKPVLDAGSLVLPGAPYTRYTTIWVSIQNVAGLEGAKVLQNNQTSDLYVSDGSSVEVPVYLGYSGAGDTTRIYAKVNGLWTNGVEVPIGIDDMINPDYSEPEDHSLSLTLPNSISLGQDLTFTIELWEDADYYTFSMSYRGATGIGYEYLFDPYENPFHPYESGFEPGYENPLDPYEGNFDPYEVMFITYEEHFSPSTGTWTIPGYYFTRPGIWRIGVNAYRRSDAFVKYGDGFVAVVGDEPHPAPQIQLLTENPRVYDDVLFSITPAENAENISVMLLGADSEYSQCIMLNTDGQSTVTYTFNSSEPAMRFQTGIYISAASCQNGLWSEYSGALYVPLSYTEDLADAAENCGIRTIPANPNAGDEIDIDWDPVPGAEWYEIAFDETVLMTEAPVTKVTLNTFGKDPSGYGCYVYACASGKLPALLYTTILLRDSLWKPELSVTQYQFLPGQQVSIHVLTSGGDTLRLYANGELFGTTKCSASGEQDMVVSFAEPGIYRITAETTGIYSFIRSEMSDDLLLVIWDPENPGSAFGLPDSLITLPNNLTAIGDEAFHGITNVVIRIPESVQNISPTAFDSSVVIVAPAGSSAAEQCESYGLTVVTE